MMSSILFLPVVAALTSYSVIFAECFNGNTIGYKTIKMKEKLLPTAQQNSFEWLFYWHKIFLFTNDGYKLYYIFCAFPSNNLTSIWFLLS